MSFEKNVEALLVRACKANGLKAIKTETLEKGFPDRIVFDTKNSDIYYIEAKNKTSYGLSPKQEYWKKVIIESGGLHFVIDGMDEMRNFINIYINGVKNE